MMNSQALDKKPPTLPPATLSIDQFCERYGITKMSYFRLRDRGEGPAEVRIGTRKIRITEAAAAEWEAQHTYQPEAAASQHGAKKKVLR
jgi:predicted DNA-binding transcriptional regulator AlpA